MLEYNIKSDYKEVSSLCKNIRGFCLDNGLEKSVCSEIEICLTEAINNIVKHAYEENFTQSINVKITLKEKLIKLELTDHGISRREFRKPTLEFDPNDIENLPEGGMGLYIIDQLMDEISYKTENGVNIFTMKKVVA